MKPRNKRLSAGQKKGAKRGIHVKGQWKAVELDPSLFSEEGMDGLMCFEELTNYRLVDTEKAAAKAAKQQKRLKKKATKRKASEAVEGEEKASVESKDGEETAEPPKKKVKKKKKKNKKQAADQSVSTVVAEEDLTVNKGGEEEESPKDSANKDDVQSKNLKKNNKRREKKQRQQRDRKNTDPEPLSEPNQDRVTKTVKIRAKNWTNRALCGSGDSGSDVSAWKDLFVPSPVLKALSSLGFGSPTPIQALALPPAIRDRMDILGAAETGNIKIQFIFPKVSSTVR